MSNDSRPRVRRDCQCSATLLFTAETASQRPARPLTILGPFLATAVRGLGPSRPPAGLFLSSRPLRQKDGLSVVVLQWPLSCLLLHALSITSASLN